MINIVDNDISFCDSEDVQHIYFLLYFTASWCGPCQKVKPLLEKLSQGFDPKTCVFCMCDIDENEDLCHNFQVRAVPTFILMRGNRFVDETGGADIFRVHALLKKHIGEMTE
jgi:thioredoxin-like negative regulator of GroEL